MEKRDPIVVAIGGTGASKEVVEKHYTRLVEVSAPDVPTETRLFALKDGGQAPLQDTYDDLKERIRKFRRTNFGRKVITLGHSQGGVHAAQLGVDRLSDAVVSLAAPIRGGVTRGLPSPAGREMAELLEYELSAESEFMKRLIDGMEHRWPRDVPLDVIAAPNDIIVPTASQYGVDFPGDHAPREYMLAPIIPFATDALRRKILRVDDRIGLIDSHGFSEHVFASMAPGLTSHLRQLADELHPDVERRNVA